MSGYGKALQPILRPVTSLTGRFTVGKTGSNP